MPRIVVRGRDLFSSKLENNGIVCPRMDGEMILRIDTVLLVNVSIESMRRDMIRKNASMNSVMILRRIINHPKTIHINQTITKLDLRRLPKRCWIYILEYR